MKLPKLPKLLPSKFRTTRDVIATIAYAPFIALCMSLPYIPTHIIETDPVLDEETYELIDLYSNHRFWYLSVWNLLIQILFGWICFFDMVLYCESSDLHWQKTIYKLRCYIFHGLVVPISTVVGMYFWPLFMFPKTRKIILPDELNVVLPFWIFILLHSVIFYPFLIEHILLVPVLKIQENFSQLIYIIVYSFHVTLCLYFYHINERWLYPFFDHIHLIGIGFVIVGGYIVGHAIISKSVFVHNYRCRELRRERRFLE